jgi:5-formyltetrahydrofolate cyclo-ligase
MSETDLSLLRTSMRERRRAQSPQTRRIASRCIAQRLVRMRLLRKGRRIAVYNAIDGEIDLNVVIRFALQARCMLYVPHIVDMRARKMTFVALSRRVGMISAMVRPINPRLLDLVLVPLVAFDLNGWRLGFGAGFYDRKFAFLRRNFRGKPQLIGVGYEFQRVESQEAQPWDVRLNAVVTERQFYRC